MKEEDMNFEDAMKALEQIANELENGELSLEQSVCLHQGCNCTILY